MSTDAPNITDTSDTAEDEPRVRAPADNPAERVRRALSGLASPCISICRIDETDGLCVGCQRTLEEVIIWGDANDALRRDIWQRVYQRRAAYEAQPTAASSPAPPGKVELKP